MTFDNGYSPALSLLTGIFEIAVAVWALRGPGRARILRPVALLLVLLAGYQFLEVLVCRDPAATIWARLGFIDVVWLPPLGLWLLARLQGARPGRTIAAATFVVAAALSVWIAVDTRFVSTTVCQVVIASYHHGTPWHLFYGALYELGCSAMVFWGIWQAANLEDPVLRRHAADLAAGTAAFMILAMLTQLMLRDLDPSLPSLMCHYALVLALFLSRLVHRENQAA